MSSNRSVNIFIFILLSLVWGSSFILIKKGLVGLTAFQVASLRIISSGLILLPLAIRCIKTISQKKLILIFLSGFLGSLAPSLLFCIAQQRIDSSLVGTLNALTPICTIILGALFFKTNTARNKILGILTSFTGSILLFFAQPTFSENSNIADVLLVFIATVCYGINVNIVGKYLKDIPSINIVSVALALNAIPASILLYYTGYFQEDIFSKVMLESTGYTILLGVIGTAAATVIFYMLIKRAGVVFSSMVTYAIPAVALIWGIIYGEAVGWKQIVCLLIILSGVFIASRSKQQPSN